MLLMRRRPNRSTRRNASKRRGTPPATGMRGRGRGAPTADAATSSIDLDIGRVLRCAGDCVTLEEVMDVLARWLGGRAPAAGPSAPPTPFAVPSDLRRRATLAGTALAHCRARFVSLWRPASIGSRPGALA